MTKHEIKLPVIHLVLALYNRDFLLKIGGRGGLKIIKLLGIHTNSYGVRGKSI